MTTSAGQTFAGYEIVAKLGEGGMGSVWKARQPLLNRFVALKVMGAQLSTNQEFIARFIREAASAAALNHPNIVQVYTAGETEGSYYFVMEFVEGESLKKRLDRAGCIEPVEAIALTLHIAQALQYAWNEAKLIHRDIKPDNIFLSVKGVVKVGDLGLAKSVGAGSTEMTATGMMMGSPHYISPEQARALKDMDFRADIYSLGCTLYHMVSGRTAYTADDSLALVLKHVTEPPPDIRTVMPDCPPPLVALIGKMMAKDRNERHASYEELIAELWQVNDALRQPQPVPASVLVVTPVVTATQSRKEHVPAADPNVATMAAPTVSLSKPSVVREAETAAPIAPRPKVVSQPKVAPPRKSPAMLYAIAGVAVVVVGAGWWFVGRVPSRGGGPTVESPGQGTGPTTTAFTDAVFKQLGNVFTNSVGAEMVYIPPGEFMLGSTKEEREWAAKPENMNVTALKAALKRLELEGQQPPRRAVIRNGFWLGRTEVTVGQWRKFAEATGYRTSAETKGSAFACEARRGTGQIQGAYWCDPKSGAAPQDGHAVTCISWEDATAFCKWLTEAERKSRRLPPGYVMRLPGEAEWEYACRGGKAGTRFWWGDAKEDGEGRLHWCKPSTNRSSVPPVDSFGERGRNGFGLADMLGNVWEWCLDHSDPAGAHVEVFTGSSPDRILKGGGFESYPLATRCASRDSRPADTADFRYGFRVCCGVDVVGGDAFIREVAALPAEEQVKRVVTELKKLNPDFDGKEEHIIENGAVTLLTFSTAALQDVSPLRAMTGLQQLSFRVPKGAKGAIRDLSPLRGLRLTELIISEESVADLSPLAGMPLKTLNCSKTLVSDLTPLKGMPLQTLMFAVTRVSDLSPLQGMLLTKLQCHVTSVSDFSPLKGAPLRELHCNPAPAVEPRNRELLRGIRTLEKINNLPPAEFWRQVEEGKLPRVFLSSGEADRAMDDLFVKEVAALPAEQQVARVVAELKKLNSDFDGREKHKIGGGNVIELELSALNVTNISPVRALKKLRRFVCVASTDGKKRSKLNDLTPLQGLSLAELRVPGCDVSDLSVVRGMPLDHLGILHTRINDLSPLQGAPLTVINCDETMAMMPRNLAVLRSIKTLKMINISAQRFWQQVEAGEIPKP